MPGFTNRPTKDTSKRYGRDHRAERERWATVIQQGGAYCQQGIPGNGSSGQCLMTTRLIPQGSPRTAWVLGHNDAGTAWIGPVHHHCNQRDGASRGGLTIAARRKHIIARATPHQRW